MRKILIQILFVTARRMLLGGFFHEIFPYGRDAKSCVTTDLGILTLTKKIPIIQSQFKRKCRLILANTRKGAGRNSVIYGKLEPDGIARNSFKRVPIYSEKQGGTADVNNVRPYLSFFW